MSAKDLPKGGFNQGLVVPLVFQCPKDCVCNSTVPKKQYHKQCGKPSFISDNGDIFCENHLNDCSGYFIQDASFQCNEAKKNNTWYQHKNASQICMGLANALQAAENNLSQQSLLEFTQKIMKSLGDRWHL